jgi:hypothetical protein
MVAVGPVGVLTMVKRWAALKGRKRVEPSRPRAYGTIEEPEWAAVSTARKRRWAGWWMAGAVKCKRRWPSRRVVRREALAEQGISMGSIEGGGFDDEGFRISGMAGQCGTMWADHRQ